VRRGVIFQQSLYCKFNAEYTSERILLITEHLMKLWLFDSCCRNFHNVFVIMNIRTFSGKYKVVKW